VNATGLTGDGSQLTAIPAPAALTTASGSAPSYSARAWINFNGTGTVAIRASGNVSSLTDVGVGSYTVNFTTAMDDTNYSVVEGSGNNSVDNASANTTNVNSAAAVSFTHYEANVTRDIGQLCLAIFR
jgi:hypothetical protein